MAAFDPKRTFCLARPIGFRPTTVVNDADETRGLGYPTSRISASARSAGIAEFERELIKERTGACRDRAKARGVRFGRKPKLTSFQRAEVLKRRAAGETLAEVARSYAKIGRASCRERV